MKRWLALVLAVAMVFALAACGEEPSGGEDKPEGMTEDILPQAKLTKDFEVPSDFKFGLICIHDENSTYDLNFLNSMNRVKEALGLTDEQVIIKRNIPESNDCYEAAKDLAAKGCNIIFADSFGHETYLLQAAKENPNVQFGHATGTMAHTANTPNFHNAFASIYEGRYVAGIAAGMKLNELKAAGKLKGATPMMGYVGAFTYAEVISGYSSFYLGAKSVCPDVQMKVQFTGSWYDEAEEKSAAQALIAAGCDLISQHADSLGAPTACEDAGVPNVSYNGSTFDAGENTFLISSAIDWAPYFMHMIRCYCTGAEIEADWTGNMSTGSIVLTGLNMNAAAEGTKEALVKAIEDLKAGTVKVYDVTKDNYILVGGQKLTTYTADVDTDDAFTPDTEAVADGEFKESVFRSAPYFDVRLDGIELLNNAF